MPLVTATILFPPPSAAVLFPNPLATIVEPLSAGDTDRRHLERVFVAVLGDSVADNDARITDRSRNRQNFELGLGKITKRVQIVHLVTDIEEGVLGIVAGRGRTDDHSGGVLAVAGDVVRGGCVTAQRSEIGNGVGELALSLCKPNQKNERCSKTDYCFHGAWGGTPSYKEERARASTKMTLLSE